MLGSIIISLEKACQPLGECKLVADMYMELDILACRNSHGLSYLMSKVSQFIVHWC